MSSTDRQNQLIAAEDWKKVYQTLRHADFKSYDFDTLRRTMISYLRQNYPEDFNDYVESSEYLALIDLIAFVGQNLAFRYDLNARENFIELADRRESLLRLARLLSYNVKRAIPASGLLKLVSVKTTEDVFDSNGRNLANQTVQWNDSSNNNWYEQFVKILNAAFPATSQFGKPEAKKAIEGVITEQYRFNSSNALLPVYGFDKTVNGRSMNFEVVSSTIKDSDAIEEEAPFVGNALSIVYRDDGQGYGSPNSGFFSLFKQGTLQTGTFVVNLPTENDVVNLDVLQTNETDIWLYKLDSDGFESELWTRVESLKGNNIVYNSLDKSLRNIYSVQTKAGDRLSLLFSDGVFGNLPKGSFKLYYRVSNGLSYNITPNAIRNVTIELDYTNKNGGRESVTLNFSLRYTVTNATERESDDEIRRNAPANFYVQNRMVTGEDYNLFPLTISQDIAKVKAVNRTSTGISRYLDLLDSTGKYSHTNIFGNDGVIYRENYKERMTFSYNSKVEIESFITNSIERLISSSSIKDFYYSYYKPLNALPFVYSWNKVTEETNRSTGYFTAEGSTLPKLVGPPPLGTTSLLRYIEPGSLVKFIPPTGYYFDSDNNLVPNTSEKLGYKNKQWVKIISVSGDGTAAGEGVLESGLGPITLNDLIPDQALVQYIVPKYVTKFTANFKSRLVDLMYNNKNFAIRYDHLSSEWKIIDENNLNKSLPFNLVYSGDTTNRQRDSSWLIKFELINDSYDISYRSLRYVFESDKEVRFFFDSSDKVFDPKTGKIIKDQIKVLSINTKPDSLTPFTNDISWVIVEKYKGSDGYQDSKKIQISFLDSDEDGVLDNPESFEDIVSSSVNENEKFIFFKRIDSTKDDFYYQDLSVLVFEKELDVANLNDYNNGDVFYFKNYDIFKIKSSNSLIETFDYQAFIGRDKLKFQYIHAADNTSRIDPSTSNFIDLYLLSKSYDISYRNWLKDTSNSEPLPPSTTALSTNYGAKLNKFKSISDEIVFHPVKYRSLFGSLSSPELQAKFLVVKNPEQVVDDNDVKVGVINAINDFFALENWDFGETFWFQEMSTYVMTKLSTKIVNFVIVPKQNSKYFGSLFQLTCEPDEIFISSATVSDVEITDNISVTKLNAAGLIVKEPVLTNSSVESTQQDINTNGGLSY